MKKSIIYLVIILILLSSCDNVDINQSLESSNKPSTSSEIPTPSDPSICTITGSLYMDTNKQIPVAGASLYLGEILKNSQGTPIVATMNRLESMRAVTDEMGRFIFTKVPANDYYSLIFDKVVVSYMLNNPEKGGDFIIKCEGGEVDDLGKLIYAELP